MLHHLWLYQKSLNLYYRVLKNPKASKALIFLHGLGATNEFWTHDYFKLYKGYSLYFVDLLGFGYSRKPNCWYTAEEHINALQTFISSEVEEKVSSLVGHSAGAAIALCYLKKYPETISKAILLSFPYFITSEQMQRNFTNHLALTAIYDTRVSSKLTAAVIDMFRPVFLGIAQYLTPGYPRKVAYGSFLHTCTSYFGTLHNLIESQSASALFKGVPKNSYVLMHGSKDRTVPLKNIQELEKLYEVPLITLQGDHDFPLFQAEKTVAMLKKYI